MTATRAAHDGAAERRESRVELWQKLVQAVEGHIVNWKWVRGHVGHVKNEYANHLAITAAREQLHSNGAVPSQFEEWLAARQARGQFPDHDPDAEFTENARQHLDVP